MKVYLVEFVVEIVDGRGKLIWKKKGTTASTAATAEEFQNRDSQHLHNLKKKRGVAAKQHKVVAFKRLKELTSVGLNK